MIGVVGRLASASAVNLGAGSRSVGLGGSLAAGVVATTGVAAGGGRNRVEYGK